MIPSLRVTVVFVWIITNINNIKEFYLNANILFIKSVLIIGLKKIVLVQFVEKIF
jgi:hypothetical protein